LAPPYMTAPSKRLVLIRAAYEYVNSWMNTPDINSSVFKLSCCYQQFCW